MFVSISVTAMSRPVRDAKDATGTHMAVIGKLLVRAQVLLVLAVANIVLMLVISALIMIL